MFNIRDYGAAGDAATNDAGARLMASKDPDATFLAARDAVNVSVTGSGELFGRGVEFMQEDRGTIYWLDRAHSFRPRMIHWIGCQNVTFHDLTIRDAPVEPAPDRL